MELFGLLCSLPAAFVASVIYSNLLRRALKRLPLRGFLFWSSLVTLCFLASEWALLGTIGAVRTRALIGPLFYPAHVALFFLSVPALANILVIKGNGTVLGWWFVIGLLSAMFALPLGLTQFVVSEALYGVDGQGGPYGSE